MSNDSERPDDDPEHLEHSEARGVVDAWHRYRDEYDSEHPVLASMVPTSFMLEYYDVIYPLGPGYQPIFNRVKDKHIVVEHTISDGEETINVRVYILNDESRQIELGGIAIKTRLSTDPERGYEVTSVETISTAGESTGLEAGDYSVLIDAAHDNLPGI